MSHCHWYGAIVTSVSSSVYQQFWCSPRHQSLDKRLVVSPWTGTFDPLVVQRGEDIYCSSCLLRFAFQAATVWCMWRFGSQVLAGRRAKKAHSCTFKFRLGFPSGYPVIPRVNWPQWLLPVRIPGILQVCPSGLLSFPCFSFGRGWGPLAEPAMWGSLLHSEGIRSMLQQKNTWTFHRHAKQMMNLSGLLGPFGGCSAI